MGESKNGSGKAEQRQDLLEVSQLYLLGWG